MKKILGIAGCCIALLFILSTNGAASGNGNVVEIPGKIEAKNYTYFSGTDTEEDGGSNIFWIKNNGWFSYIINVAKEGMYQFNFHVASNTDDGKILFLSNEDALTETEFTNTDDRESLQIATTQTYLKKGEQNIYILFQSYDTEALFSLSHMIVSEIMPIDNSKRTRNSYGLRDGAIYHLLGNNNCGWNHSGLELTYGGQGRNVYVDTIDWYRTASEWRLFWNGYVSGQPTWKLMANRGWSERTLDVQGASTEAGANVQVYRNNGTKAQLWVLYPSGTNSIALQSVSSGQFLHRAWASCDPGTNVHQYWNIHSAPEQQWVFVEDPF